MEAFLTECCFVFGCQGIAGTKEDSLKAQIADLRCTIRKMILLQAPVLQRNGCKEKEELELPLYELVEGQLRPTGAYLST